MYHIVTAQKGPVRWLHAAGGNPSRDYQLPEAVIKFKQGFGRLIRTRTDHGTVVCLDPRIVTKPYGRLFLDSLPDCRRGEVTALGGWNVRSIKSSGDSIVE